MESKFSGKTHLINIFLKKFKGFKIECELLNDNILKENKNSSKYNSRKSK